MKQKFILFLQVNPITAPSEEELREGSDAEVKFAALADSTDLKYAWIIVLFLLALAIYRSKVFLAWHAKHFPGE